ncbi:LysR family transcriptional regulator [Streptomyces sp. NBC_01224]|uniref:LysR family transcriptional regulator n=1 Tax=Streptomyces sp. NBC_01224 TaxID=2903783 RepID=UPI002E150E6A|nr:LysR family transcriptional regulator [Streptomyces sp. NBC_01224]
MVRALERELDTPLFDRTTHRVALTPAGEAFVPAGRTTLHAAELARAAVNTIRGSLRGRVTVGTMQGLGKSPPRPGRAVGGAPGRLALDHMDALAWRLSSAVERSVELGVAFG